MKYSNFITVIVLGVLFILTPRLYSQNDSLCKRIAIQSVDWMQNGNEEKLYKLFNKEVAAKLDLETTRTLWPQLQSQYGEFIKIDTLASAYYKSSYITDCILSFEKGKLKYRLSFDKENKIAGIFFSPYVIAKKKEFEAEENDVFKEIKTNFTNEGIEFPAILCLPKTGLKAMVVFVHGSGPNDMDETIGPNKIFKQIAHLLASYGIGSLRYDKRTYLVKQGVVKIDFPADLQHIIISDASAAVDFVSNYKFLNNSPIFILGHSMGAFAAPLIASENANIDGIVMMAANARPLEDLIVDQYKYLYARGGLSQAEKKEIKKIKQQAKNVKSLEKNLGKGKIKELPLVNDTNFWLSLNAYKQMEVANNLNIPILNLHGDRDYQVPLMDFKMWYENTNKKYTIYRRMYNTGKPLAFNNDAVTFIAYSGLNHLFIYGKENSYPEEYNRQGNVSKLMVSDIANWITVNSTNSSNINE